MSIGLVVPLEHRDMNPIPVMERHLERIQLAETLGFSAVWLRDVPFHVPSFGDAGQLFDPFVYLGFLAAHTHEIGLGVASIILPLRHPAHVAKSAASVDVLSGGRLLLGIASGDRPEEYPAMQVDYADRGQAFRQSYTYIRAMSESYPRLENQFGQIDGTIDLLPKPVQQDIPLLITGSCQQDPDWVAQHGDGWMTYPRPIAVQQQVIGQWRARFVDSAEFDKPVVQPLYIDLIDNNDRSPQPLHLGFRSGLQHLLDYLHAAHSCGVNHIALNLRFNEADIESTLEVLAREVLPAFHHTD